jgi:nitric oxide reductase subunit C
MAAIPWWANVNVWKHLAIWVTVVMLVVLIILTWDTLKVTSAGGDRVPPYSIINHRIDYVYDESQRMMMPVVGGKAPLFGRELSEEEARRLVDLGKKTVQGKNCMNCHTLLGNGAYYAPDLTKTWLDPAWGTEQSRELLMLAFLQDPDGFARTFGTGRKMPQLDMTEEEIRGTIAFLKWMAAIHTNGFPTNFRVIPQAGG